jgi:hypothetical protein
MAYVKLRLRDHFLQEWNSNLENSPIYWYHVSGTCPGGGCEKGWEGTNCSAGLY